jgi:hypothetical protein
MDETTKLKKDIKALTARVKMLEDVIWGLNDDPTYKAKIRKAVIDSEHVAGKPTIIGANNKRYNLQTV